MIIVIEDPAKEYITAKTRDRSVSLNVAERPGGA